MESVDSFDRQAELERSKLFLKRLLTNILIFENSKNFIMHSVYFHSPSNAKQGMANLLKHQQW